MQADDHAWDTPSPALMLVRCNKLTDQVIRISELCYCSIWGSSPKKRWNKPFSGVWAVPQHQIYEGTP
jgi:hypothetical protein